MSDSGWATLAGLAVFAGLRLIDYLLPRGYVAKWIDTWARKDTKEDDEK